LPGPGDPSCINRTFSQSHAAGRGGTLWHSGNGGPALNTLGSIMLAMSLIIVIVGYAGYRLLSRGEKGSSLDALTAIAGEG
jgi:hypothetical protein